MVLTSESGIIEKNLVELNNSQFYELKRKPIQALWILSSLIRMDVKGVDTFTFYFDGLS